MVKLTAIGFDYKGKEEIFEIPESMKIAFNYNFGTVKEEVSFAGGLILALPRGDVKLFLIHESDEDVEKAVLKVLYFDTEEGRQGFKIPRRMAISFQKIEEDKQKSINFAGTVYVRLIAEELPF